MKLGFRRSTMANMKPRLLKLEKNESRSHLYLSEEIIIEILIFTDAKTLFRSKCVCKKWQTLISEQSFINRFIKRSKSLPPSIIGFFRKGSIFSGGTTDFLDTSNSNNSFNVVDKTLSFISSTSIKGAVIVVDSNNGLLLCANQPTDCETRIPTRIRYLVCNPVTKQWIALPLPEQMRCNYSYISGVMLYCYDVDESCAQKTEFKVYSFRKKYPNMLELEVYSSETRKWKKSRVYHYVWSVFRFNCNVLFKGCAYWLEEDGKVVVFDVEKETIGSIQLPQADITEKGTLHMGVSAGSLYVIERRKTCFLVWILVDGVEFHLNHSIEIESLISEKKTEGRLCFKILGFHTADYKLILMRLYPYKAALYGVDKKRLEHINDFHPSIYSDFERLFPYSLPAWPTCIPNT